MRAPWRTRPSMAMSTRYAPQLPGFTAAKFHPFGQADRDIELARAIRHEFPNLDL